MNMYGALMLYLQAFLTSARHWEWSDWRPDRFNSGILWTGGLTLTSNNCWCLEWSTVYRKLSDSTALKSSFEINNTRSVSLKDTVRKDKKNQLDVTFCILYFSSNSCSTCFGQPCAHHQDLTTAWCYSLVLVCAVAAGRLSSPVGR